MEYYSEQFQFIRHHFLCFSSWIIFSLLFLALYILFKQGTQKHLFAVFFMKMLESAFDRRHS